MLIHMLQRIGVLLLSLIMVVDLHAQEKDASKTQATTGIEQEMKTTILKGFVHFANSPGLVPSAHPFGPCPAVLEVTEHIHAHYSARERSAASKVYRQTEHYYVPVRYVRPSNMPELAAPQPDHAYQPIR